MLRWIQGFTNKIDCEECKGTRLKKESLYFRIDNKNIAELSRFDIITLKKWFVDIEKRLNKNRSEVIEMIKEILPNEDF